MQPKNIKFLKHIEERLQALEFAFLKDLAAAFPAAGLYLVGGAVRDAVLGRESKDYDFVVSGVPAEELQKFLGTLGIVNLVGRVFGVLKFTPDAAYDLVKAQGLEPFDIALPRTDVAAGTGGYRDVEVHGDPALPIEKDLERRDFTINAMAVKLQVTSYKLQVAELVDPFGGIKDIENKIIRAAGKPQERFQEDYTRLLRAVRFASELGFIIELETKEAIEKLMVHMNDEKNGEWVTPRETIAKELIRAYVANPVRAFDLAEELGIHRVLIPEMEAMKGCPQPEAYHSEGDVFTHTKLAISQLGSDDFEKIFGERTWNALLVFTVLFHDIGKPPTLKTPEKDGADRVRFDGHDEVGAVMAEKIVERLKLSSMPEESRYHIRKDHLVWLIRHHLIFLNDPEELRTTTIEKYFFNPYLPGDALLRLGFCDGSAALPPTGKPDLVHLTGTMERIRKVGIMTEAKKRLPKALINGDIVMEVLGIKPSARVGEILLALREKQLLGELTTKEEAIAYTKEHYGS